MKFIFLIGVEGTGHSMMNEVVFGNLMTQNNCLDVNDTEFHGLMLNYFSHEIPNDTNVCRDDLINSLTKYVNEGRDVIYNHPSFPFDQPRDTLRRIDIIELVDILKSVNGIEIKLMVMTRDPKAATYSALRRHFTDNIRLQCKIVEDNYVFINSQIQIIEKNMPGDSCIILDYDNFINNSDKYRKIISGWMGISETLIDIDKVKRNSTHIPEDVYNRLCDFFTDDKIHQWDYLYTSEKFII